MQTRMSLGADERVVADPVVVGVQREHDVAGILAARAGLHRDQGLPLLLRVVVLGQLALEHAGRQHHLRVAAGVALAADPQRRAQRVVPGGPGDRARSASAQEREGRGAPCRRCD